MRWLRRVAVALSGAGVLLAMAVPGADAATTPVSAPPVNAHALTACSAEFFDADRRLGPAELPVLGPVGRELLGYHRTGHQSPADFLAQFYDSTAGSWRYPPDNGYQLDPTGQPIEFTITLLPGQDIDRFGSEYGSFLAPEGLPYAARSIPPQSLDGNPAEGCNYRDYRVLRPFPVHAGPIAAWFDQPGGGLQYQLDAALLPGGPTALNVLWLVNNGYLARI